MDRPDPPRAPRGAKPKAAVAEPSPKLAELRAVNEAFKAILREKFSSPEDLEALGLAAARPH
jgi:hypothetical protein